jgi:multicomponent Na+:H+ antiporter subunit G
MILIDIVSSLLLIAGCALGLIAAVGLHRFPDVFTRMHASTKPATLGLILVVLGTALRNPASSAQVKLLLVVALQLLTAPAGAHMIGRAAHRAGEASDATVTDELAQLERHERHESA